MKDSISAADSNSGRSSCNRKLSILLLLNLTSVLEGDISLMKNWLLGSDPNCGVVKLYIVLIIPESNPAAIASFSGFKDISIILPSPSNLAGVNDVNWLFELRFIYWKTF